MRLEVPVLAFQLLSIDQLRPVRLRGPARQPTDVDKRLVVSSVDHPGLHVELQFFDIGAFIGRKVTTFSESHSFETMEKPESYSAPFEQLVKRCENRIAH